MSGGESWWEDNESNFSLNEEKHETGYCLELWSHRACKFPVERGPDGAYRHIWINVKLWKEKETDGIMLIDRITVPVAERLAKVLSQWAREMRDGGHYKEIK
jgi:hypothetical protein